jgi:carboxyl-terminal processing protease
MQNNLNLKLKTSRSGMHKKSSFMKKNLLLLAGILLLSSFTIYKYVSARHLFLMERLMGALDNLHFKPVTINDEFSEKVYNLYVNKRLDYTKKFLTQADVDQMSKYRRSIDDEITSAAGKFDLYQLSVELYLKRLKEREIWYKELLAQPFDYTKEEEFESDFEKAKFPATDVEAKDEWRRMLKYQVISRIDDALSRQEKAKEKSDTTVKILSFDSLEVDARRKTLKANNNYFKRLKKVTERERFSTYLNSITGVFDPHTEYFAPVEKKKFDELMSGQFEGIGARLMQQENGIIKITEIVAGSPSEKQGELKKDDEIHKVAQGDGKPVDVTTMEIDDAILLIKGKKGTTVNLTVKKPDGSFKVIPIIRDVIETEETFAKSAIINNGKKKMGYIYLPGFYANFNRLDPSSARYCSKDVRKEIEKLKAQNIDGLIIDLRNNGGGSLQEVVDMAGLFISKGPVVQVKGKNDMSMVMEDYNPDIAWTGPLSIMVNRNSASASEILAAAMQDYKRAIIVGTPSYGKGTVQSFVDLDQQLIPQLDSIKPLGQVKITMQKFYRVNGGATQLKGVVPDVTFPDPYELFESGEKDTDYPLQWDEMPKAIYSPYSYIDYDKAKKNSEIRTKNNPTFKLIETEAKELKAKKDDTKYNLALDKYRTEQKEWREQAKKYDNMKKDIKDFNAELLKVDIARFGDDTTHLGRENRWAKNLSKDIYVNEAANILADLKSGDVATTVTNPK